jgi:hypothetical protein
MTGGKMESDIDQTCEIKWFDAQGRLTPDKNPSIGRVRIKEHDYVRRTGETMHFRASRWMRICEQHAQRLPELEDIWEWEPPEGARDAR